MRISSGGGAVGRNFWDYVDNGTVTIRNTKTDGYTPKTVIYTIKKGEITGFVQTNKDSKGSHKVELVYGSHKKTWLNGKLVETERYRPGTSLARIYKGEWKKIEGKVGEFPATFRRKCFGGSFRAEEVRYKNKKLAYKVSYGQRHVEVYYPDGKPWLTLVCPKGDKIKFAYTDTIFGGEKDKSKTWRHSDGTPEMENYDYLPCIDGGNYDVVLYDKEGKIKAQGKCENRQKINKWIENYEEKYYMSGVLVTKEMYDRKPEEWACKEILALDNAQFRTSLMAKVGTERFLKECEATSVHKDGDYELFEIPITPAKTSNWRGADKVLHLLKVKCPSTGAEYVLKVPPDTTTCEQARRWTLGIRQDENVQFVSET